MRLRLLAGRNKQVEPPTTPQLNMWPIRFFCGSDQAQPHRCQAVDGGVKIALVMPMRAPGIDVGVEELVDGGVLEGDQPVEGRSRRDQGLSQGGFVWGGQPPVA